MKNYDLVVIGGGVGGLVATSGAAQLGARVALVDKAGSLGGDCLHAGCVPTKRLVHSARIAQLARKAPEFGIKTGEVKVDFAAVMESVRGIQELIGEHDDPERFRRMGVELFFGTGRFTGPDTFEIGGETLKGKKFLIATGSGPALPDVPGLEEAGVLTNLSVLELTEQPASLLIFGGGPIAVEYAQVFARLGTKVTMVEKKGQLLPREDPELSALLKELVERDGVKVITCPKMDLKSITRTRAGRTVIGDCGEGNGDGGDAGGVREFTADEVFFAIGRRPNVAGLDLEAAGVEYDPRRGIKVDDTLRTTNSRIYACGDVIGHFAFTHVAEYQAGVVISNALFPLVNRKVDYRAVPWTTFTDPELARVGLTEAEAREKYGDKVRVYRHLFKDTDRAVIEGEGEGLIKLVCDQRAKLLGAHILGPGAGELIGEYVLSMQSGLPVTNISKTIHVYPTVGQAVKRAADRYYAEKLFSGWFPKLARWLIRRGG